MWVWCRRSTNSRVSSMAKSV
uniref:Uncharacterized protein n=1 Tax=Anguilla anguilla TaxID=7936 RepID=A0A0E9VRT0_ANGAN